MSSTHILNSMYFRAQFYNIKPFIGNPDLVTRMRLNIPLLEAPVECYYGDNVQTDPRVGYTDFST